jgi:hypothetical protein
MGMNKKQREDLERCTGVDKLVRFKYKGTLDKYLVGTVEDEVSIIVADYKHLIQRIRLSADMADYLGGEYAYRTGYFTLTAKTRKPVWGQYHTLVPASAYHQLIRKANQKGWLGLSRG